MLSLLIIQVPFILALAESINPFINRFIVFLTRGINTDSVGL
jgi:hypothetical protein